MSYINQFIKENQLKYPGIFRNSHQVMKHLLFVGGNGYYIENGNPYLEVEFARKISFKNYFSGEIPFRDMKDYYISSMKEDEVQKKFKDAMLHRDFGSLKDKTDDEIWDICFTKFDNEIESLVNIDEFPLEKNSTYWLNQILESHNKYWDLLYLVDGYYAVSEFNENTDKELLEYSLALIEGYILYYENIPDYSKGKRNPFSPLRSNDINEYPDILNRIDKDVVLLNRDRDRIICFLEQNK